MRNADDTKVLELQFENKDFEKNATQSISTLEKLKESLDFTDSTKGLEDINSNIKAVNFSNLTNGIREATNGFNMLEVVAFGVFNRLGGRIADFAVDTLGKLFSYVPNKIMQGGFTRATNVDQAEFLLKGMGKDINEIHEEIEIADKYIKQSDEDAQKAGKSIKTLSADINSAVSGTSFGYDQAAKAASQLAASNVEVGNDMRSALQGISGVAAMTNSSYDEIAYVFTKVAASGKAMNGELRMLSDRGLPVTASIAKYMNSVLDGTADVSEDVAKEIKEIANGIEVTEADVVEFASKSKISWGIFKDAMFDAYADQAFKANETYEGVISNIGAQLARIGEIFAGPFRDDAIPVLQKVYDIIKKVRDIINDSLFAAGVIAAMKKISDALVFVLGKVDAFLGKVREVQKSLDLVSKVKGLFGWGKAAEEAEDAADKMTGSFEEVRDTALKVIKGDWGNGMARMQALTEAGFDAQTIQDYVNALWEVTGHDWSKVFDEEVQKQAWAMLDLGEATSEAAIGSKELTKQTKEEQKALREAVHQLPKEEKMILSVANAFAGASNVYGEVKQTFSEKFKMPENVDVLDVVANKVYDVSDSFATFTTEHGEDIATIFGGIYDAAMLVVGGFTFVGRAVWSGLNTAFNVLGITIWDVIVRISGLITNIRNWVTENKILELAIGAINGAIASLIGGIKGWYDSFMKIPAVQKTIDKFKVAFTDAFVKTPYYLSKTSNAVKQFSTKAKRAFTDLRDKKISPAEFFDEIKSAWKGFTYTIGNFEFIKNMREGFVTAKDGVKEWVNELGNNEDGTRNTFGKITDTATSALDWVTEKIKNAWTGIGNFFKEHGIADFFGDNFAMFRGALKRFFDSLPGFATGLKEKWGEFMKKVTDMGGFKFENAGQIWQAFQDTIGQYWKDQDVFAPIKSAFELMKNSAKDKLKEVGIDIDAIIAYVKDIPNKIKNFFTNGETGEVDVGYGINKIIDSLKTAFSTGGEAVEEEGDTLVGKIKAIPGKIAKIFTDDEGNLVSIPQIIANILSAISNAFSDGGTDIDTKGGTLIETIKGIPGKIVAIFTDDEGNLASIPEIINNIFTSIIEVFTGTTAEAAEVTPGLVTSLTDAPSQVKTFFDGWSLPEAFDSFIGMFTRVDAIAGDKDKKSNMTDLGGKFKEFASRVKAGLTDIPWDKITNILGLIGAFAFLGGSVSIVRNVRKVVEDLTNTFGKKAEARNLTAWAVLKIAAAIWIVGDIIGKLKDMFNEDPLDTGKALIAVSGIGILLTLLAGWKSAEGNLTALSGLGSTLEAIGIAIVVQSLKEIQDAKLTVGTWAQAGIIAGALTALSAIAVVRAGASASPIGLLVGVASLLMGVNFMIISQSVINLAKAIDMMKGLKKGEAKKAAENFTLSVNELFNGLSTLEIDPDVEDKVNRLSNIVSLINGLGKKTAWSNVLGTAPQRGIIGSIKGLLFGGGKSESIESNAAQVGTTVDEVAGVLQTWSDKISGIDMHETKLDAVEKLVRVFSSIADFGWADFFLGTSVSGKFVMSMTNLADGVSAFYAHLSEDFDAEQAKTAADVVYALGRISKYNLEGATNFKDNAKDLALGVNEFVGALDKIKDPELARTAADLAGSLAGLMNFADLNTFFEQYNTMIPNALEGTDKEIPRFTKLEDLTTQITKFVQDLGTIEGLDTTTANISTISESVNSLTTINLSDGDIITPSKVTTFTDNLKDISTAMLNAASTAWFTTAGINKLKENADTVNSINLDGGKTGEETGEEIGSGLEKSKDTVAGKVGSVMQGALDAVKGTADEFSAAGKSLMLRVANGMIEGAARLKPSAATAASKGAEGARGEYNSFKSAGAYLVEGFCLGITRMTWMAQAKARQMAKAAKDAAKNELAERSPSKEGRKIGAFFGEGFAMGIADYNKVAYDTSANMAKQARDGLNKAVDAINRIISSDLDATPVIRPVLDLTEIQNGAMSIGSMLDTTPSVALAGNLGAINASMTNRTDPNAELLTALGSLKDTLGSRGDTYNINGVTYDDGSNIADAVGTLVRAARVERRV